MQAAEKLNFPDAGYVLHLLEQNKLPLPKLSEEEIRRQATASLEALMECRVQPSRIAGKHKSAITAK